MELREARIIRGQESDEINDRACGACRGLCCSRGGDHAFITQATILRYGLQHPGSERQDIIDDYVSFLGDEISEGGCVFQGSKGCTLPRVMRSNVCNTYFCSGLKSMYKTEKNPSIEAIAIAACRGSEIDMIDMFVKRDRMMAGSGNTRSLEKS
jgi:Fe-S-cluster containining protein